MGIFENREYFEKLAKVSQTGVGDSRVSPRGQPSHFHQQQQQTKASSMLVDDMLLESQKAGLKAAAYSPSKSQRKVDANQNDDDNQYEGDGDKHSTTVYQATTAASMALTSDGNQMSRPSMLKKKSSSQTHTRASHFRLKVSISVVCWVLIVQVIYMIAVFNLTQPVSKVRAAQLGKAAMSPVQIAYIIIVFVASAFLFGWICFVVWMRRSRFLVVTVTLAALQLPAFLAVPVMYFNPSTTYRHCFGVQDCLRYTMPICLYILTNLVMIACFSYFAVKKIRKDSNLRTIRFNLTA